MDSRSFVAREGMGYVAYLGGERLGWHEFQSEAEQHYRDAILERHTLRAFACTRATETRLLFSHTRPDGSEWLSVFPAEFRGYVIENVAAAPSLRVAIDDWWRSPPHQHNLLEPVDEFGLCEDSGYYVALGFRRF